MIIVNTHSPCDGFPWSRCSKEMVVKPQLKLATGEILLSFKNTGDDQDSGKISLCIYLQE